MQYSQKQNGNDNNHNRKVSRQCTDRYLQCRQGTVLNITGSYKYTQLIQQLVRSLEVRVKNTQTLFMLQQQLILFYFISLLVCGRHRTIMT